MKQFDTAARRNSQAILPEAQDVTFMWGDVAVTATVPSAGQMALMLAAQPTNGRLTVQAVRSLFDFLAAILDQEDYDMIESDLQEGVDLEVVVEVVQYLVEEWSARPTTPSPASSPSRRSTGRTSTGRRVRAASTSGT